MQACSPAEHLTRKRMVVLALPLLIMGCVRIIPCCITLTGGFSSAMHSSSLCKFHYALHEDLPDRVMQAGQSTCRCFWSMKKIASCPLDTGSSSGRKMLGVACSSSLLLLRQQMLDLTAGRGTVPHAPPSATGIIISNAADLLQADRLHCGKGKHQHLKAL